MRNTLTPEEVRLQQDMALGNISREEPMAYKKLLDMDSSIIRIIIMAGIRQGFNIARAMGRRNECGKE